MARPAHSVTVIKMQHLVQDRQNKTRGWGAARTRVHNKHFCRGPSETRTWIAVVASHPHNWKILQRPQNPEPAGRTKMGKVWSRRWLSPAGLWGAAGDTVTHGTLLREAESLIPGPGPLLQSSAPLGVQLKSCLQLAGRRGILTQVQRLGTNQ